MAKFFSTINGAQWVTLLFMVGAYFLIGKVVPTGPGHDVLMGAVGAIGAQAITSTRTPSDDGGTTKTASNP